MTPSPADHAPRAQLSVEEFEQLARSAPETVTLELVNGKLEVKPVPDGDHGTIFMWLLRQCMQHRPDLDLHPEQGLMVEAYREGRARPDGALAPRRHFAGQGEWAPTDGVLMAVEVTSHDRDTDRRDRNEKPLGYAAAEIPVYLLIDRESGTLVVHSEPDKGRYRQQLSYDYGDTVVLPQPVDITLDTDELKDYAR
ncbi:Uma2 family endonuclease [Streptomyces cyaneofuscatus]|uniref:Uma2 family endonuclease n=1 Tax=Streptomyces cyaneofuscatus TaxID=66883 RepID=A0ABZ1EZ23_9ACTN|nr:Uma2 family endonuclease [Streptomyces cyaneofuscatus]WSB09331.1 Uma2 family endonuclease [Streptomyces cyaneofuscatus]WSD47133.1 Uma2 family endonuclease [Streptomyces cyaneofuscatus]